MIGPKPHHYSILTFFFCGSDMVMGLIAGTLFWQGSDDPTSVLGILFQSLFYVSVGAMLKIPAQFADRGVFYKQQDANFFPPSTYVLARSIAGIPASVIDGIVYGTIVFWFVGLAFDEGASVANYFMFMLLIFVTSMTASLIFGIFSTVTRNQSIGQAGLAVSIFLMVLFSGYTVSASIPSGGNQSFRFLTILYTLVTSLKIGSTRCDPRVSLFCKIVGFTNNLFQSSLH